MLIRTQDKKLLNFNNIETISVSTVNPNYRVVAETVSCNVRTIAIYDSEKQAHIAIDCIKQAYINGCTLVEFEENCIKRN